MEIEQNVWGFTPEGEALVVYTMRAASGACVRLTNIGAAVLSVEVPDRNGELCDVVLGYERQEDYLNDFASMGKCVGRYAGLIPTGTVMADGTPLNLSRNDQRGHLDGGRKGFGNRIWESRVETNRVVFSLYSTDGEEGYPGGLSVEAVYDWDDGHTLEITLLAKSESPTPVNLTQHIWFDVSGSGDVSDTELSLAKEPACRIGDMDFGTGGVLWRTLESGEEKNGKGDGQFAGRPSMEAVRLYSPESGIAVSVQSTHPAVFAENGNCLQGAPAGKNGLPYTQNSGISIRTGAKPLRENPVAGLDADSIYENHIIYNFGIGQQKD